MPQKPAFGPEQFEAGDTIIQQGDVPDRFYIITRGKVEVVEQDEAGGERPLRTLKAGDYFGEVGLMTHNRRVATVRALTPLNVMSMDHKTFTRWIDSSGVIRDEIEALVQQRTRPEQRQAMPPAAPKASPEARWPQSSTLFETEKTESMETAVAGQIIIKQGRVADTFYMIVAGLVEVISELSDGSELFIEQLGPGDYFGEIGLLEKGRRLATVRAVAETRMITFDRRDFLGWLARNPESEKEIKRTATRRLMDTGRLSPPASDFFDDSEPRMGAS